MVWSDGGQGSAEMVGKMAVLSFICGRSRLFSSYRYFISLLTRHWGAVSPSRTVEMLPRIKSGWHYNLLKGRDLGLSERRSGLYIGCKRCSKVRSRLTADPRLAASLPSKMYPQNLLILGMVYVYFRIILYRWFCTSWSNVSTCW